MKYGKVVKVDSIKFHYDNEIAIKPCIYCFGTGRLKAMQMAMTYGRGSVRAEDTFVECPNCNGRGIA